MEESFVVALQDSNGRRTFYSADQVPAWREDPREATRYTLRHEAEGLARLGAAMVLPWREAYDLCVSLDDGAVQVGS